MVKFGLFDKKLECGIIIAMKLGKNIRALIVASFFLALLGIPLVSKAYIDPGTGSLIIQTVIASVAAIGLATRIFWSNIKAAFSKNKTETDETQQSDNESQ